LEGRPEKRKRKRFILAVALAQTLLLAAAEEDDDDQIGDAWFQHILCFKITWNEKTKSDAD
jgi:hypothetical protein